MVVVGVVVVAVVMMVVVVAFGIGVMNTRGRKADRLMNVKKRERRRA